MAVHPVILCGGAGTRLWPASREASPKQFISLIGARSSFQETVARVSGLGRGAAPIIVAGVRHQQRILEQLAAVGAQATVLLEPEARDSAPAMAAAAAWIERRDPEGVAVLLAADHHVPDAVAFREAIDRAVTAAARGWIVTLGVAPTAASTAYGYIRVGGQLPGLPGVCAVDAFVEKPDGPTAAAYVETGYLWNSGNFIVAARELLAALDRFTPDIGAAARASVDAAIPLEAGVFQLGEAFRAASRISIDYAVMERTDRAAVAPVAFAWSDLGAWDSIWAASPKDVDGNASRGAVHLLGTRHSLVRAVDGMTAAVVGGNNLAVIVERDTVLVCDLASSQGVKAVATAVSTATPAGPSLAQLIDTYTAWLSHNALPLWWALGADHVHGGFHEELSFDGRAADAPRRARVVARQAHTYATAGAMGWSGPWRAAAEHAWAAFESRFRRPDGLFRTVVASNGCAIDDTAYLYDQDFAALALASLHKQTPADGRYATAAADLLAALRSELSHARGFREAGEHPYQANAHMHLLEASLAWVEAGGGEPWRTLAAEIVDLALERFIDAEGGFLREFFDADWRPAPGPNGRLVEPGHQFEWAWLLDRWAELSGDERAALAARRLALAGAKGLDPARDVVIDALDDSLSPWRTSARLWPQTERLKTSARFALRDPPSERARWLADAHSAARGLWRYLDVEPRGLWRDKQDAGGAFRSEPAPASSLYHLIEAVKAIQALAPLL
jgi:mannose-1-phosphate guanylyltransferase / mannose-6-phosphate isomerase